MNWFTSMFSADASEGDLITSGALNATKITGGLTALIYAAVVAWHALTDRDGPLQHLSPGQNLALIMDWRRWRSCSS